MYKYIIISVRGDMCRRRLLLKLKVDDLNILLRFRPPPPRNYLEILEHAIGSNIIGEPSK